MERGLHLLTCLAVAVAAGCRGCGDDGGSAGDESLRSEQSARARLLSRMSARKLDRNKVYPKDDRGNVQCDRDIDCFILQAERCTPASLLHTQTVSGYGISQHVHARYRITGTEVNRCKIEREVLMLDITVDPVVVEALRKKGKSEEEIAALRTDGIASLRGRNPARLECFLTGDQALEAGLNLAEGRYNPLHWRTACRELPGKPPQIGSGEPPAQAAQAGPGAAATAAPGEAPAKADVPAPKQP